MRWLLLGPCAAVTAAPCAGVAAGGTCAASWQALREVLRPTQPSVGFAWVARQKQQHFASAASAAEWLATNAVPAVAGPQGLLYLTDNHHHLAAIEHGGDPQVWALNVTVFVVCDLRALSAPDFWSTMAARRYVYLFRRGTGPGDEYRLPVPAVASDLPGTFALGPGGFSDDLWRSLAGFASHEKKGACYAKTCTPFQDFEWAYMMNDATAGSATDLWAHGRKDFFAALQAEAYPTDVDTVDTAVWDAFGATLDKELCHEKGVASFALPAAFPSRTPEGFVKAGKPPDPAPCKHAVCSSELFV